MCERRIPLWTQLFEAISDLSKVFYLTYPYFTCMLLKNDVDLGKCDDSIRCVKGFLSELNFLRQFLTYQSLSNHYFYYLSLIFNCDFTVFYNSIRFVSRMNLMLVARLMNESDVWKVFLHELSFALFLCPFLVVFSIRWFVTMHRWFVDNVYVLLE